MPDFAEGGFIPCDASVSTFIPKRVVESVYGIKNDPVLITEDQWNDGEPGEWTWFDQSDITLEAENVSPDFIEMLTGAVIIPTEEVTAGPVNITAERKDGTKLDFVLYKVKFEPFRFDPFNRWYKKLLRLLVGKKRATKFLMRKALTISYTGKAGNGTSTVHESVGRLGPSVNGAEG